MASVRTEVQQLASRLNGQKSRDPKTAEGKAVSSQNALKHGCNSPSVVLWCENQDLFNASLQALTAEWQPQSETEAELVTALAQGQWRIKRLLAVFLLILFGKASRP